ncbi:MAG: hypothetical protein K2Y29_01840 [Beijerinckiaceae bacterium]|nr:hypothetical protein [Beijerinckiaceae bacterium]
MTRNAVLIAIAGSAAAAVWAGALFLPEPALRRLDPLSLRPPAQASAREKATAPPPAEIVSAPEPPAPEEAPVAFAAVAPPAYVDPAIFGHLHADIAPPAPPAPPLPSMVSGPGALPLMSSSLAASTLQSLGATFSDSALASALPQLGGAAALDGPADAGLEDRVNEASLPDPQVPPPTGKIIALDASEGTKLDPLRQRNWDLNATQQVPALTPPR